MYLTLSIKYTSTTSQRDLLFGIIYYNPPSTKPLVTSKYEYRYIFYLYMYISMCLCDLGNAARTNHPLVFNQNTIQQAADREETPLSYLPFSQSSLFSSIAHIYSVSKWNIEHSRWGVANPSGVGTTRTILRRSHVICRDIYGITFYELLTKNSFLFCSVACLQ